MRNDLKFLDDFGFYGKGLEGYVHYNQAVNSTKKRKSGGGGGSGGSGCSSSFMIAMGIAVYTILKVMK